MITLLNCKFCINCSIGFTPMAKLIREFLDKRESVDREQSDVAIRLCVCVCVCGVGGWGCLG